MYEYIQGKITDITPAYVVIDCNGVGYLINISLNTYSALNGKEKAIVFVHHIVREDAQLFFGFSDKSEREIFRHLISVSGVGANTGRTILSSLAPGELTEAILSGNTAVLNKIKGIGAKTAQRIIVDLKDKVGKSDITGDFLMSQNNTNREEALSALVMLGFTKSSIEKILDKLLSNNPQADVETLVKLALKSI